MNDRARRAAAGTLTARAAITPDALERAELHGASSGPNVGERKRLRRHAALHVLQLALRPAFVTADSDRYGEDGDDGWKALLEPSSNEPSPIASVKSTKDP